MLKHCSDLEKKNSGRDHSLSSTALHVKPEKSALEADQDQVDQVGDVRLSCCVLTPQNCRQRWVSG